MKYLHTNIINKDWKKLADFYIKVFNCEPILSERCLKGKWLADGTGIKNASLKGIHLVLPGYDGMNLLWKSFNMKRMRRI